MDGPWGWALVSHSRFRTLAPALHGLAALILIAAPGAGTVAPDVCPCDCGGLGRVSISDLVRAVRLALGADLADCPAADRNGDGRVTVDELIAGVNAALVGCPPLPATATATRTASPSPLPSDTASPVPPSATASSAPSATPSAAVPSATASATPSATPPLNFLIINLDDARADGLDRMPYVQSSLLPESLNFPNAFVPYASCCPSRASLLTGLYAIHHGTRQVSGPIGGAKIFRRSGADQRTIAVWLRAAGYATGLFGKYLNEYNLESDKGPDRSYYIPPGWTRFRAFVSEHYGGVHGPGYELVDEHGERTRYDDHDSDAQYSTDVTGAQVRQFIADSVAAGQPFFALWTPYAPHLDGPDFVPIPADRHLGAFADMPLFRPPNWGEADRSDKPRWVQALGPDPLLEGVTDLIRKWAYETLLAVDEQLRLIIGDLQTLDVDRHTVVLLTSDNGVAWGEHTLYFQSKACPYEPCLRVPFLVRLPGGIAPGEAVSPALNIDIAPTVAALAQIALPPGSALANLDGISLVPALHEPGTWSRDDFLLEQWRQIRSATLVYTGQPADGDRVRLFYGSAFPKASVVFEFDDGDGTTPESVPVSIGVDAATTYQRLGAAVVAAVPDARFGRDALNNRLTIFDGSEAQNGYYWWDEVNQAGGYTVAAATPDFFGVRDVRNGYTYVEYETGEVELYDLTGDPWQLDSVAGDPAYAAVRARLAARMRALADLP